MFIRSKSFLLESLVSLLNLGLGGSIQTLQPSSDFSCPTVLGLHIHKCHTQPFLYMLGVWTQVLMLVRRHCYQLSPLLVPNNAESLRIAAFLNSFLNFFIYFVYQPQLPVSPVHMLPPPPLGPTLQRSTAKHQPELPESVKERKKGLDEQGASRWWWGNLSELFMDLTQGLKCWKINIQQMSWDSSQILCLMLLKNKKDNERLERRLKG